MKKFLVLMLVLLMAVMLAACTVPAMQNPDGTDTVAGVAIMTGLDILQKVVVTALGIAGTVWAAKSKDNKHIQNIALAFDNVLKATRITVGELKQTTVDHLKAESEDGKLTQDEIAQLNSDLLTLTLKKLDEPTKNLLAAAGVDICALIAGAGEDWVRETKLGGVAVLGQIMDATDAITENTGAVDEAAAAIEKAAAAIKGE